MDEKWTRLVQNINPSAKLLRAWELKGGISAQVTALEMETLEGMKKKVVVREHGQADLKRNPQIASDEFKLLQILKSAGLPTPTPYHLEASSDLFPTPCLVIEFIEGRTVTAPADLSSFLQQVATVLTRIHSVDASGLAQTYLPKQEEAITEKLHKRPAILDKSLDEGFIREVLESVWPLPQANAVSLLHGDFWPGNTMWKEEKLVAVIDWEDAAIGDPLSDLGNARLEILWAFGVEAMHVFTLHYQSASKTLDYTQLPYWDLCAALRPASSLSDWGLEKRVEETMRERHSLFVMQACEKLGIPYKRHATYESLE
ncbi:phosphotransferase family protein [Brevibacillus brevis]|uniref:Phosphotransferase family protein n=1 Tax=Brevibacillus brevis TaxID=1393 RepID=A0A2Z4MMW9_BREBE|nr:phosphotransferase [Brevibacillus brevis]AWX57886.1 phosphotransferase family protein [Brevibacillus brevis]